MNDAAHVHPTQSAAYAYVGAFVDELARSGLRHVCICPGSRSTPLALLCTDHDSLRVWTHIDERSAAFFALGLAKATGEPVALIATSGTAVANFLPAVTEAFFGRVPLLLLTADRPHELRDIGSNQTLYQAGIFGAHVKWSVDMPLPEDSETMLRHARTTAGRAMATARSAPAGPVQLNFPLREPLIPLPAADGDGRGSTRTFPVERDGGQPYVHVWQGKRTLPAADVAELAAELIRSRRPLIVCGPDLPRDATEHVMRLAARIGCPLLADPLSGLRTTGEAPAELIDAYDTFLRFEQVVAAVPPSLIVRFGAMPVSKALSHYLQQYAHVPQIVVDEGDRWRDPTATAARMLHVDGAELCRGLVVALDEADTAAGAHPWPKVWQRLNQVTRESLEGQLRELAEPFEGHVFQTLADMSLDGVNVYVGNSMPIRDFDTFFPAVEQRLRVFGNRGVSGIDGLVSSALGVSAADDGPVLLLLGDLSFYHDLNGLLAAGRHNLDVTIVVINNDGGGIFSFLPQARHGKHFETLFGTPIGLDFAPVVDMYGGTFVTTGDVQTLREQVESRLGSSGLHVIEFVADRGRNAELHRHVFDAVGEQLTNALGDILRSAIGGPG